MTQQRSDFNISPMRTIIGLIFMILILYGLYSLAVFIFKMLMYLSPVLLIATAVIDYSVITGFFNWLGRVYKSNSTTGIILMLLSAVAFPITSLFLFSRAMFRRKINQLNSRMKEEYERRERGTYTDFEEIDEQPLELPKRTKVKPPPAEEYTDYEDLFDE